MASSGTTLLAVGSPMARPTNTASPVARKSPLGRMTGKSMKRGRDISCQRPISGRDSGAPMRAPAVFPRACWLLVGAWLLLSPCQSSTVPAAFTTDSVVPENDVLVELEHDADAVTTAASQKLVRNRSTGTVGTFQQTGLKKNDASL